MLRRVHRAIVGAMRRAARGVVSRLPEELATRGLGWGDLGRRTLLGPHRLRSLRSRDANPRLAVAARIAAALGLPVEGLWRLDDETGGPVGSSS